MAQGVAGDRIQTVSYGKERPFCTEGTESCWQQNRRALPHGRDEFFTAQRQLIFARVVTGLFQHPARNRRASANVRRLRPKIVLIRPPQERS